MQAVIEKLSQLKIVPVITLRDAKDATPLAKALCAGGLPCAEVTFRTAAAAEGIYNMTKTAPDMLVGAGTVLTVEQAEQAIGAGAKFIVAPGLNPAVVRHCIEKGLPVVPGVMTPGEIEQALALGLTHVKFFPAEAAGGVNMLRALSAPYAVKFMPTGGISPANLREYLSIKSVFACGGSWMVKEDLIAAGEFDKITQLTREAVEML